MRHLAMPDGSFLLKVDGGEEVLGALTAFLDARRIYAGAFCGLGAVAEAEVAHFDPKTKVYKRVVLPGPLEVLSLTGNVARFDGRSFIHAHVVLGDRDMNAKGGHLFRATAEPTCELVLRPWEAVVERRLVPEAGLKLLDLPAR